MEDLSSEHLEFYKDKTTPICTVSFALISFALGRPEPVTHMGLFLSMVLGVTKELMSRISSFLG